MYVHVHHEASIHVHVHVYVKVTQHWGVVSWPHSRSIQNSRRQGSDVVSVLRVSLDDGQFITSHTL